MRQKDATSFLIWIMSVKPDALTKICYQKMEHWKLISLNVYQNAGIEKHNDSRQSLEYHAKTDEMRRFTNKKFDQQGP